MKAYNSSVVTIKRKKGETVFLIIGGIFITASIVYVIHRKVVQKKGE